MSKPSSLILTAALALSGAAHGAGLYPYHGFDRVQASRTRQENRVVITSVLLAVTAVSMAVVAVLH